MKPNSGAVPFKLYIASYGLKFSHITRETLAALETCGAVFTTALGRESAEGFARQVPALKKTLRVINWGRQQDLDRTVLAAFAKHRTVGFLTFGNPAFLNGNLDKLAHAAGRRGAEVVFLDAVSSIDSLLTLFRLNLQHELRLIDAPTVSRQTRLLPGVNTMFFSVGRLNQAGAEAQKRLFIRKITGAYSPASAAYLASACFQGEDAGSVCAGTVAGLPALLAKAGPAHTLFLPANSHYKRGAPNFGFYAAPAWLKA